MRYPFLLYDPAIRHAPVFQGLTGPPFVLDLSRENPGLKTMDSRNQKAFQHRLEQAMAPNYTWGLSGYLERRDTLLSACPQMVKEARFHHLGLDIIVPLGTRLHAPLDATVAETGYEAGEGNYGGWVLLRHASQRFAPFYSLYGHLCRDALPTSGVDLRAGDGFARIGDFHENGNWFHHTHLQVITEKGFATGYVSKGYCSDADLPDMETLCPSPVPLFRVSP